MFADREKLFVPSISLSFVLIRIISLMDAAFIHIPEFDLHFSVAIDPRRELSECGNGKSDSDGIDSLTSNLCLQFIAVKILLVIGQCLV